MTDATQALTRRLTELLRREHAALADFLLALADFDRQRRWRELGHTSCFYFLHRQLGLSKGAAFYRATAAALVQRYPEVIEPLRDGRLCLSSVSELAKVITPENRAEVLPRFFHASKLEAKAVVAELRPAVSPPTRDAVTPVVTAAQPLPSEPAPSASAPANSAAAPNLALAPAARPTATAQLTDRKNLVHPDELNAAPGGCRAGARPPPRSPAITASTPPEPQRDQIDPLTGDLRRLHTTVSRRFLGKLAAARDALSHSHPGATTEDVLEAALDLLLAKKEQQKGLVAHPRPARPASSPDPRHVPAAVRREVWRRDAGRCQWPLACGGVCGSTVRLELDHVVPVARGGLSTIENLRVLCGFHNRLAAEEAFGGEWIRRFGADESARAQVSAAMAVPSMQSASSNSTMVMSVMPAAPSSTPSQ